MSAPMNIMLTEAIAASGVGNSAIARMEDFDVKVGTYSLQLNLTGDGTVKIELFLSNDGTNFIEHTADIATGVTVGNYLYALDPIKAAHWYIKITETGTSDAVAASLYLNVL